MSSPESAASPRPTVEKRKYVRAVGPRLRKLLYVVFALVALLAANAVYLLAIKGLKWVTGQNYGDYFYLWMILLHLVLGLLLIVPLLVFGTMHLLAAKNRRNRRAVRIGYALFAAAIVVLVSGVLLTRVAGYFDLKQPVVRLIVYWLHVVAPLVAAWLYWLHRLVGPRIKWRVGGAFAMVVSVFIVGMLLLQAQDPRAWGKVGSEDGKKYFHPSPSGTHDGKFVSARALMNDQYCLKCHQDVYDGWLHSAHRFSSFNNPAYLTSIAELRAELMQRDGNVKASRWCAGCHDPVPFFSGKFDDPDYDILNDPTAHAGITCTACHAITHINSNQGNADYTIEEPLHYPFAYSKNPLLQAINNQLVKAKPEFHRESMLKPFHKTTEFCGTCHKVHLPKELNQYKEFLRGQNHYDSFLLSGVSGHGIRSFYYPPKAELNCNRCHMPLAESNDFGAKHFDDSGKLKIHDHTFPSANTAVAYWQKLDATIEAHQEFLRDVMQVDIFGVKEEGTIDGTLHAPLRPNVPTLRPGSNYLLETVIRTMKMGHLFTQGTADSNEVWMDVTVFAGGRIENDEVVGGRVIGRSGGMDEVGEVDPYAHYVNIFMLDRNGKRIDRRNAEDIFVPLYNHQIPPGAASVVHYGLQLPPDLDQPLLVELKLKYRKFDKKYLDYIAKFHAENDLDLRGVEKGAAVTNRLPVTTLAVDRLVFPVAGAADEIDSDNSPSPAPQRPSWQRWNDYGIGLLLEGQSAGGKGELRQAEEAFKREYELVLQQIEDAPNEDEKTLLRKIAYHGPLNLARVFNRAGEFQNPGELDDAVDALNEARRYEHAAGFPSWTAAWLSGIVNRQQGHLDLAIENLTAALETKIPDRQFNFEKDYVVINELGMTIFERAKRERGSKRRPLREALLRRAAEQFERALQVDSENVTAHHNLTQIYRLLGDQKLAEEHERQHARYKPDESARDFAVAEAQKRYPHAKQAAKALTIYQLHREGAPGLPTEASNETPNRKSGEESK